MKGQLVANAFTSSDTNPYFTAEDQPAEEPARRHRLAHRQPELPLRRSGGGARGAGVPRLERSGHSVPRQLRHGGLRHRRRRATSLPAIYETYRTVNRPSDRPTAAQVQAAIRNWKNQGFGIADITGPLRQRGELHRRQDHRGRLQQRGRDRRARQDHGGRGGPAEPGPGRHVPRVRQLRRRRRAQLGLVLSCSAPGSSSTGRWCSGAAGLLDRKARQRAGRCANRLDRAQTDLKYKSDNGYLSYSKGGEGSKQRELDRRRSPTSGAGATPSACGRIS